MQPARSTPRPSRPRSIALVALVTAAACASGAKGPTTSDAAVAGSGGQTVTTGGNRGSGGAVATGGTTASGGMTGAGGSAGASTASGGSDGTGGAPRTGGVSGRGGAGGGGSTGDTRTAGASGSGGAMTGGTTSQGGARTGGTTATGGASATGGANSTGGARTGGTAGAATGSGGTAIGSGGAGTGGRTTGGTSGGGSGGTGGSTAYHPCPTDGSACKIMPFGDSITDGFNADTPGGYRVELFRLAHSAGKNITFVGSGWNGPDTVDGAAFPHNHEGHSGWTIVPEGGRSGISTLLKNDGGSQSVMVKYTPHIVLLMIGTNDAIDNYDMTNAPTRLGSLIDTIYSQLPDVLIVVAQPIPSRGDGSKGDDTALSARIKTYDDAIPAVVKARADAGKHILIVDMWTPFNPTKTSLLEDQWHPNLQGYVVLGTQWYQVLKPLL